MPGNAERNAGLEIGHVLFVDIVGYSKRLVNEQTALIERLNRLVRGTEQFGKANAAGKLITIPTGDGMALVFFTGPDAPVRCAIEINQADRDDPKIELRMGIHSGPVDRVADVNQRTNVAGTGINLAQRVMDVGDAGHILLSNRSADDLAQYDEWKRQLHDLGEVEAKHGVRLGIVSLYNDGVGNPARPSKLREAEKTRQAAIEVASRRRRRRRAVIAGSLILVLLVAAGGTWAWHRRVALASAYQAGLTPIVEKSIAVLPFDSFEDKDNAYLADAVQDDILTDLTKVADLKVISRRSAAQYRGTNQGIREIGKALRVAHVLEGSVRKVANQIHVTAQLIDTRSETQVWTYKYDRDIGDVIEIQNDISQTVVSQLKAALSPTEKAAIEEKPTRDKEAYDLYLRARALVYGQTASTTYRTGEDNAAKAIPLLESAIARDPNFALAYCVLGEAQSFLEEPDKAEQSIEAALRISPGLGEGHLLRAGYLFGDDQTLEAEKELKIAAAALPGRVEVFDLRAAVEEQRGQWKLALRDRKKACELDPQNLDKTGDLIFLEVLLRNYVQAERLLDQTLATAPQQSTNFIWRNRSYIALARGDTRGAMAALDSSPNRNAGLYHFNHLIGQVFLMERNYQQAEQIIQSAVETAKKQKVFTKQMERNDVFRRGVESEKLGKIARFRGEQDKARKYFEAARLLFEAWLPKNPAAMGGHSWPDAHAAAYIAEIDAALGRKDEAIHEGEEVVKRWSVQRDSLIGSNMQVILAVVYMWSGERNAALQQLMEVAKVPVRPPDHSFFPGFSAGELKLNPLWDELRDDPRFAEIIEEAAKPIRIE